MDQLLVLIDGDRSIELKDALSKRGADFLKEACVHDDNTDYRWPTVGGFLLYRAAKRNARKSLDVICQKTDIESKDGDTGWTVLHHMADKGKLEMCEKLLELGANPNSHSTKYHERPLHFAVQRGESRVARLLISKGADINAVDRHGWTPMHYACLRGRLDCVKLLHSAGADTSIKSRSGMTAIDWARDRGHTAIVDFLARSPIKPQSVYTTIPAHGCELEFEDGKVTFPSPPEPNLTIKTPVIQTFGNPDMQLGDIKYRVEKAVIMGPDGVTFDKPVDVTVQLSPLAEGEKVYLIHTSNNDDNHIEWSEEEEEAEAHPNDSDDSIICCIRPREDHIHSNGSAQILDEEHRYFHTRYSPSQGEHPTFFYDDFRIDRNTNCAHYRKRHFSKEVLLVTLDTFEERIKEFTRTHLHFVSCRLLVYARPLLDDGVNLWFAKNFGTGPDAKPAYHRVRDQELDWEQVGFSDHWFILSPEKHWLRLKLRLGEDTGKDWKREWRRKHGALESCLQAVLKPVQRFPCAIEAEFFVLVTDKPDSRPYKKHTAFRDCPGRLRCAADGRAFPRSRRTTGVPFGRIPSKTLQKHLPAVERLLQLDDHILHAFQDEEIITREDWACITRTTDRTEKIKKFVSLLPERALNCFVRGLWASDNTGNGQLAEILSGSIQAELRIPAAPESSAACATALRPVVKTTQVNPWQMLPVKEVIFDLIGSSKLNELRVACYSKGLLTPIEKSALRAKTDSFEHNELLIEILEKGGGRTFDCFLSILSKLDSLIFRNFFERLDFARGS